MKSAYFVSLVITSRRVFIAALELKNDWMVGRLHLEDLHLPLSIAHAKVDDVVDVLLDHGPHPIPLWFQFPYL